MPALVSEQQIGANLPAPGGAFDTTFGLLGLSAGEITYRLDAADSEGNTATASGQEAAFTGAIAPKSKQSKPKPRRKVRISLEGWLGKTVYAHFIPPFPKTKSKKTIKIGKTRGNCGKLTKRLSHLFPFKPTAGAWQVVLDTKAGSINFNAAYRAAGYRLPDGRLNPDYPQYLSLYEYAR